VEVNFRKPPAVVKCDKI